MAKTAPFDRLSEHYDDWFVEHADAYRAEIKALKRLLPPFENGVEIGVGTGRFAEPLGIKTGVEPSEKMAKIAKQRGIRVIPGVAEKLPLPDSSYDLALMVTTICFVDDPLQSLREIYRILRPGGTVMLGFVDAATPLGRNYLAHKAQSRFYKEARFFTTDEVLELLKKAGFSDCRSVQTLYGDDLKRLDTRIEEGYGEGAFVALRCRKK